MRVRTNLIEIADRREIVDAVLGTNSELGFLPDLVTRCRCLNRLIKSAEGIELIRAGARIGNILRSDSVYELDKSMLIEAQEKELYASLVSTFSTASEQGADCTDSSEALTETQYDEILAKLVLIVPAINAFFDKVMVNDEDRAKRENRHALLQSVSKYFRCLADFSKLLPIAA